MECNWVEYYDVNGNDQVWNVGIGGVTKILRCEYSPESHCTKFYVQVFIEGELAEELHRFNAVGLVMPKKG